MKKEIIYFFDPICGWCYGFSEHLSKFAENHSDEYEFSVVTGGMVRGENARPIGERKTYLKEAYPKVQEMSGAEFGQPFLDRLEEGSTVFGSDIPSLVFHAIVSREGNSPVEVAKAIQREIYLKGIDPLLATEYDGIGKQFNTTLTELDQLLVESVAKESYEADLYTTQQFGISGFPFVVAKLDEEYYQVARGFRTADDLEIVLEQALKYHKEHKAG